MEEKHTPRTESVEHSPVLALGLCKFLERENAELLEALKIVMSYSAVRNALEPEHNDQALAAISKATRSQS